MLYEGAKIIKKPIVFNVIPWLSSYTAQGCFPYILLPKEIYNEIQVNNINPKSILGHELTHIRRQENEF